MIAHLAPMNDEHERSALWSISKSLSFFDDASYQSWISSGPATGYVESQLAAQLFRTRLRNRPLVSIILCAVDTGGPLRSSLESLRSSSSGPAEILVSAPSESADGVRGLLASVNPAADARVLELDGGLSAAEAEARASELARGEFIAFLSPGDRLARRALPAVTVLTEREPELDIIYSDEDWLDDEGRRLMPRFKTGWDPDAQLGRDLLGRFCLMRREKVAALGGIRPDRAPAHHYDLHCRLAYSIAPTAIRHIPEVLYHRRPPFSREQELARALDSYTKSARHVAQAAAGSLCGQPVEVTGAPLASFINRVHWPLPERLPKVSVLIPTRDRAELVRACARGVLQETDYPSLELLILDNESQESETANLFDQLSKDPRVRVLPVPGPYNYSWINNLGAAAASGEVLVFLNNDIEILRSGWLREMVSHAIRPDIGCAGARLLYPDRRIQHAGVVLQEGPDTMHAFRFLDANDLGFDAQLAGVRSYLAVTAACLAVRAAVFREVGGFDEAGLQIAFNDVDLCLKVDEHGYRNICTPFEPIIHRESASRGANLTPEKLAREERELSCLVSRWSDRFLADQFGHPNIHVSWDGRDCRLKIRKDKHTLNIVR
jgi:O-antigen biosynthesis protein